jgi:hypothetical protein
MSKNCARELSRASLVDSYSQQIPAGLRSVPGTIVRGHGHPQREAYSRDDHRADVADLRHPSHLDLVSIQEPDTEARDGLTALVNAARTNTTLNTPAAIAAPRKI